MQITMIGHSTVLIETAGQRILTDPFFRHGGNLAYKRLARPAMEREEVADVDLVLLSHAHFDHIDLPFLRALPEVTPILAPRRMLLPFSGLGKRLQRVETWQQMTFGEVTITAVPAVHSAVSNGYVIESEGLQVYFAGDTYFRPFMRTLREKFHVNIALLPVTTYRLPMTMGEAQAVQAVQVLEPDVVIPIHLGIEPRSPLLRTRQSPEGFARRLEQSGAKTRVVVLREGMRWAWEPDRKE